jgi:hypothetical protein
MRLEYSRGGGCDRNREVRTDPDRSVRDVSLQSVEEVNNYCDANNRYK